MSPHRRVALASIAAAGGLVALKLSVGLVTGSLGLVSEAIHSASDLVAAGLTFFAVGVAGRPADRTHPFGHGKAEHLAALSEAVILVGASVFIVVEAVGRLRDATPPRVDAAWYAFAVLGVVVLVDVSRAVVSHRAARRYASPALAANALHFASDLVGTLTVVCGLAAVRAGLGDADSVAAIVVAALVLVAAGRLIRQNVDVLMDRAPAAALAAAREAVAGLEPDVTLRRLRMREAAGRHFADIVIAVAPGAPVAQGHALADRVEAAVERAVPGADVVVHVEPEHVDAGLRERVLAAALEVPRVREIHNVSVMSVGSRIEVSLHLKLPGDLELREAHEIASAVESAIRAAAPEVDAVQTHLEPLAEPARGRRPSEHDVEAERAAIAAAVLEETGLAPRGLRLLATDEGLVAFLTLGLDPELPLALAHERASAVEERLRRERTRIAEVIVHTEP
jgi:cation diffusion facilitator family transporter